MSSRPPDQSLNSFGLYLRDDLPEVSASDVHEQHLSCHGLRRVRRGDRVSGATRRTHGRTTRRTARSAAIPSARSLGWSFLVSLVVSPLSWPLRGIERTRSRTSVLPSLEDRSSQPVGSFPYGWAPHRLRADKRHEPCKSFTRDQRQQLSGDAIHGFETLRRSKRNSAGSLTEWTASSRATASPSSSIRSQPTSRAKTRKTKKEKFHSLYCELSMRVDGADEDVSQHLFAGGFEDFSETSEDGPRP